MKVLIPGFSGVNKLLAPQRIEDHQATIAIDCDFRSGDLRPYHGDLDTGKTTSGGLTSGTLSKFNDTTSYMLVENNRHVQFTRSPTFYSDNTTDPRLIMTEKGQYAKQVYETNLVSAGAGTVTTTGVLRLGVPHPVKMANPEFKLQEGSILEYSVFTGDDCTFNLSIADAASSKLASGDKVTIDAPGFNPETVYTISGKEDLAGSAMRYTLRSSKRSWTMVTMRLVKNEREIRFKASGHSFVDGDQVFLSHNNSTALPNCNLTNLNQVFQVVGATANYFYLQFLDPVNGWTVVALTNVHTTDDADWQNNGSVVNKKVALMATASSPFSDDDILQAGALSIGEWQTNPTRQKRVTVLASQYSIAAQWANAETADVVVTRAYCCTFVNIYGDESEPSLPTDTLTIAPKDKITFKAGTIPREAFSADYNLANYAPIEFVRIYRTDSLGQFRFLADVTYAAQALSDWEDTIADSALGEPLPTVGWALPPDNFSDPDTSKRTGLHGVIAAPNGVIVGFLNKTIAPSVPYVPYAYPVAYRTTTDYEIVGLVSTAAGIAVLTTGTPYLLTGTDPAGWSMVKLEAQQACVAARSIVDMGDYGMYASPDGLVAITGAAVELVTRGLLTREQWQEYNPSTIIAGQSEGRYIGTYVPVGGGARKGFIFDPVAGTFSDLSLSCIAFYNDLITDTLYGLNTDGHILAWNRDTSNPKPYHWKSKEFITPLPINFAVYQVIMDQYGEGFETTFEIYAAKPELPIFHADGDIYTAVPQDVTNALPKRMPGGYRAREYSIELKGVGRVQAVGVATSMDELKDAP